MDEVSTTIDAPPDQVWGLITDVTNMGRWSPECHRCEWVEGASGPAVGAKFKGWNKRGLMRWSTVSTVVIADEPSHFAWEVKQSRTRWGYRFEAAGDGTRVTEYRDELARKPAYVRLAYKLRLLGRDPDAIVRAGMQETLNRLKSGAEKT
ncbi:MAG: hypothetical protein QOI95_2483 [Acidimicrobiaceae bacterium]|jgi:uncharacterized protein YndB with AHSA1/START domain